MAPRAPLAALAAALVAAIPIVLRAQPRPLPPVALPGTARLVLPAAGATPRYELLVAPVPDAATPPPVLYLLDGANSFPVAREALGAAAASCEGRFTVPMLVAISDGTRIGAPGNRRATDYTPVRSTVEWARGEGGAAAFLATFEQRVVPAVERRWRVAPRRALWGHSYGGLFAVWAMLRRPGLLDDVLAGAPALYYGDEHVTRVALPAATRSPRAVRVRLYAGSEEAWAVEGDTLFANALRAAGDPAVTVTTRVLPGVGHVDGSALALLRAIQDTYCEPATR